MSESRNTDNNFLEWSPWEQEAVSEYDDMEDPEAKYKRITKEYSDRLFKFFQEAAHCLAILYKGMILQCIFA